jgi:RNA polymerase sigma-70 factor, ECF subfamily
VEGVQRPGDDRRHGKAVRAEEVTDLLIAWGDGRREALATLDPRQAKVVELRVFGGLSIEEVGAELDISAGTVKPDWLKAKLWLKHAVARSMRRDT